MKEAIGGMLVGVSLVMIVVFIIDRRLRRTIRRQEGI